MQTPHNNVIILRSSEIRGVAPAPGETDTPSSLSQAPPSKPFPIQPSGTPPYSYHTAVQPFKPPGPRFYVRIIDSYHASINALATTSTASKPSFRLKPRIDHEWANSRMSRIQNGGRRARQNPLRRRREVTEWICGDGRSVNEMKVSRQPQTAALCLKGTL